MKDVTCPPNQLDRRDIPGLGSSIKEDRTSGVPAELFTAVARERPLRAVFCNSTFASDAFRIYAEEAFQRLSPGTGVKVI
jgi:hypothetical protein